MSPEEIFTWWDELDAAGVVHHAGDENCTCNHCKECGKVAASEEKRAKRKGRKKGRKGY